MKRFISIFLSTLATVSLSVASQAQVIDQVLPAAASPGDTLLITGQDLDQVVTIEFRFSYQTTGAALAYQNSVPVVNVSSEQVLVTVPEIPNQNAYPSGVSPVGTVRPETSTTVGASKSFLFLEVTNDRVKSTGEASTQSGGEGKAVTTFDIAAGVPFPAFGIGDVTETFQLKNARPFATAILVVAPPAATPFVSLGDGLLAADFNQSVELLPPVFVDAQGEAEAPYTVTGSGFLDIDLTFQWVFRDSGVLPRGWAASKGLQIGL